MNTPSPQRACIPASRGRLTILGPAAQVLSAHLGHSFRNSCNVGRAGMKISSYLLDNFLLPLRPSPQRYDDRDED